MRLITAFDRPWTDIALQTVDALSRDSIIDDVFFDRLNAERPNCVEVIEAIRRAFHQTPVSRNDKERKLGERLEVLYENMQSFRATTSIRPQSPTRRSRSNVS